MEDSIQGSVNSELTLKELFLKIVGILVFLKKKWWIIILAGVVGGGVGYYKARMKKMFYVATVTFVLEDEKGTGSGGLSGLASQFGIDMGAGGGGAFTGSNLPKLIESRRIIEKTLLSPVTVNGEKTSFAEYFLSVNGWRKAWQDQLPDVSRRLQFTPNIDRTNFTLEQDSVLGVLYQNIISENLIVSQKDKKYSMLSVEVKTPDQYLSYSFSKAIVKEVSDFYIETKSYKARKNLAILEKQVDSIRRELDNALLGVASANDNVYNLNPAMNTKRVPSSKRQIDVQANTAMLTQLVANLELARITVRKETPLVQVIDSPILPLPKERASRIKALISYGFISSFVCIALLLLYRWVSPIYRLLKEEISNNNTISKF